jgi:hypothetical protein
MYFNLCKMYKKIYFNIGLDFDVKKNIILFFVLKIDMDQINNKLCIDTE